MRELSRAKCRYVAQHQESRGDALAKRVAKLADETLTEAVTTALRERLARIEKRAPLTEERHRTLKTLVEDARRWLCETLA